MKLLRISLVKAKLLSAFLFFFGGMTSANSEVSLECRMRTDQSEPDRARLVELRLTNTNDTEWNSRGTDVQIRMYDCQYSTFSQDSCVVIASVNSSLNSGSQERFLSGVTIPPGELRIVEQRIRFDTLIRPKGHLFYSCALDTSFADFLDSVSDGVQ